ncbi:hypothetical protein KIH07_04000 [Hydrogenophaga taeniospiralis]|uniref:hypothetical protein n=1 Tax=Hydrogenophaga taeniospiralis TaxID=65656 RepID=UPI001CFA71D7|nr:hypothetical protein [Hydrogenophaga taeniospiralis]MCB4362880.1 hypothetical protein [Hydrogenophaga taeniospiralis]
MNAVRRPPMAPVLWAALALAGAQAPASAAGPLERPGADAQRVGLVCEAVYLPARAPWVRTVDIGYDQRRVRSVHIDGIPVYTFTVQGTLILTALDNERIQIDTATQTWTSDFRGLATAQGRCERAR